MNRRLFLGSLGLLAIPGDLRASAYPSILAAASGPSSVLVIDQTFGQIQGIAPTWYLGIICTVSSGASLTYSVQVTADQSPSSTGHWNNHDILTGLTASANGNILFPVTGMRLNLTAWVSGSVNMGVTRWP